MEVEWVREHCLSLPHTTEHVQWGSDLVFKIGGKMYAVLPLEPAPVWLSFKCTDEEFATLTDQAGIIPAPYMARAKWVALENAAALEPAEIKRLLRQSYDLVLAKLPQKTRAALAPSVAAAGNARKTGRARPAGSIQTGLDKNKISIRRTR
jgi:predicted DNA-binding protein (MmcQ/YjbR family)